MDILRRTALELGLTSGAVTLVTPLSLDECVARLRVAMSPSVMALVAGPVIGRVDGSRVRARKHIGYKNSFQTHLSADLVQEAGLTRIRCRFSMHWFVVALTIAFIGFAVVKTGELIAQGNLNIGPPLLVAGSLAVLFVGRLIARHEQRFLLEFVCAVVDAREAP